MPRRRRLGFALVLAALILALVESVSYGLLWLAPVWLGSPVLRTPELYEVQRQAIRRMLTERMDALTVFDARLGWTNRRGLATPTDVINGDGIRSEREYSRAPDDGRLRISAFGDSFVYGTEVRTSEAWASVLERENADLEVLNYGVPGFGLDQAFLRYEAEAAAFSPRAVVLGVTCHTIGRNVNVSTAELGAANFSTKPRFVPGANGELELVPNPLTRREDAARFLDEPRAMLDLARDDPGYEALVYDNPLYDWSATVRLTVSLWSKIYRRYVDPDRPLTGLPGRTICNESSSAFRIVTGLMTEFSARARAAGWAPVLLILPDRLGLELARAGLPPTCSPITRFCEARQLDCLDASQAFSDGSADFGVFFNPGGHYSPEGNRVLAQWLAPRLRARAMR